MLYLFWGICLNWLSLSRKVSHQIHQETNCLEFILAMSNLCDTKTSQTKSSFVEYYYIFSRFTVKIYLTYKWQNASLPVTQGNPRFKSSVVEKVDHWKWSSVKTYTNCINISLPWVLHPLYVIVIFSDLICICIVYSAHLYET